MSDPLSYTIPLPDATVLRNHRNAVIEYLKGKIPEFREITPHGGTFSEESLKRFATIAPAAKVSVLGMQSMETLANGQVMGPAICAVYVIAEDEPPLESWDVAMIFIERLVQVINGQPIGSALAGAAQVKEWQNLFSMEGEHKGSTLMALTWTQEISFGTNYDPEDEAAWLADRGFDGADFSQVTSISGSFNGGAPI
jgi:hypothetical protein